LGAYIIKVETVMGAFDAFSHPAGKYQAYRGSQKNALFFECFFLLPLVPTFRIYEHIFEKRYKP